MGKIHQYKVPKEHQQNINGMHISWDVLHISGGGGGGGGGVLFLTQAWVLLKWKFTQLVIFIL